MTTKLSDANPGQLLDLLSERLTFERAGVKLYDHILPALDASPIPFFQELEGSMRSYRNQEKEHEEWLEAQVRSIGGTAHEQTEMSELITQESQGIESVILHDPEVPHMLHALLAAELVDNAGWDLLVELADEAGDSKLKREFKHRLHEEEKHLAYLRKVMEELSFQRVLGEQASAP